MAPTPAPTAAPPTLSSVVVQAAAVNASNVTIASLDI
jgi:hypothetical protein